MSNAVEREKPQRMLDSAMAYYRAGARCEKEPDLGTPGVVNYAFSVELYLKLLILLTRGKRPRGHDLSKLQVMTLGSDPDKPLKVESMSELEMARRLAFILTSGAPGAS